MSAFASVIPTARLQMTAAGVSAMCEAYPGPARSTLVKQQFEDGGQQADAAFAALAALNSYNRTNKLATLHELVRRLIDGDEKVRFIPAGVKLDPMLCGPTACNQRHAPLAWRHCPAYCGTQEAWWRLPQAEHTLQCSVQTMFLAEILLDGLDSSALAQ